MTKRRKKTILPRLTVLAYSRRELTAFVAAVESLHFRVQELTTLVDRLTAAAASKRRKKPALENNVNKTNEPGTAHD